MIIGSNKQKRKIVYAWQDNDLWMMSRTEKTVQGRRPIALFDSKEEVEAEAAARGLVISWQN